MTRSESPAVLSKLCLTLALFAASPAMAYEQPAYGVDRTDGSFELRRYAPRVVAETRVEGDFEDVGNEAFRRLAGYIGGDNRAKTSIAMTAPVTQEARSETIAMTAPVTQEAEGTSFRFTFTMPAQYTLETLPEPLDERVTLRAEPARRLATVQYRGTWSRKRYQAELARLREWTAAAGLPPAAAAPVWARYDPPYVPWFLRRNEIWIEVSDPNPLPH
jgi:hypothetical protein